MGLQMKLKRLLDKEVVNRFFLKVWSLISEERLVSVITPVYGTENEVPGAINATLLFLRVDNLSCDWIWVRYIVLLNARMFVAQDTYLPKENVGVVFESEVRVGRLWMHHN